MNFSLNMKYDITNNSAALTQKSRFLMYAGLSANERYVFGILFNPEEIYTIIINIEIFRKRDNRWIKDLETEPSTLETIEQLFIDRLLRRLIR